jgi:hypothetical protein
VTVDALAATAPGDAHGSTTWDAGRSGGRLIVAWQHPESRLIAPVGLLEHGRELYRFRYLRRAGDLPDFQPFLSFPTWERTYTSQLLFPMFAQRIMTRGARISFGSSGNSTSTRTPRRGSSWRGRRAEATATWFRSSRSPPCVTMARPPAASSYTAFDMSPAGSYRS